MGLAAHFGFRVAACLVSLLQMTLGLCVGVDCIVIFESSCFLRCMCGWS